MINQRVKLQNNFKQSQFEKLFIPKECVAVFPFVIKSGYQNVTNEGFVNQNIDAGTPTFFQKVFTGKENIIALWENSSRLIKPVGENYYNKQYNIGKTFFGKIISNTKGCEIASVEGNQDFMGMKTNQNITLMFDMPFYPRSNNIQNINFNANNTYFLPKDNDLYKLYLIPQLGENKWFIISNCETFSDPTNQAVIKVQVTFTSLSDKLQQSGRAIEQYVNMSAPGEGYAFPKLTSEYVVDKNTYDVSVELDQDKLKMRGVKYLQIELQGFGEISSFYAMGRPIDFDNPNRVDPPRHLLINSFIIPVLNTLNRTSIPTVNYYMPNIASVNFETQTTQQQKIKDLSQPLEPVTSDGTFTFNKNYTDTNKGKDNQYYFYNDPTWLPFSGTATPYGINTQYNSYTETSISYNATDLMKDVMNKNCFIYSPIFKLPLSYRCSAPFYFSDIPIIGGFLNALVLGVGIPIEDNIKNIHICGFCDAEALTVMVNQYGGNSTSSNDLNIPLMALGDASFNQSYSNQAQKLVGTNAVSTTLNCKLTDQVFINGKIYNTVLIGQNKNADGTFIKEDESKLLVNSTLLSTNSDSYFVIDQITYQGIFNGKIRLSAYSGDGTTPIWSTTIVSNSNWTGSSRDWTTTIKTNFWDMDLCIQQDNFTWPESVNSDDHLIPLSNQYIIFPRDLWVDKKINNSDDDRDRRAIYTYLEMKKDDIDSYSISNSIEPWPTTMLGTNAGGTRIKQDKLKYNWRNELNHLCDIVIDLPNSEEIKNYNYLYFQMKNKTYDYHGNELGDTIIWFNIPLSEIDTYGGCSIQLGYENDKLKEYSNFNYEWLSQSQYWKNQSLPLDYNIPLDDYRDFQNKASFIHGVIEEKGRGIPNSGTKYYSTYVDCSNNYELIFSFNAQKTKISVDFKCDLIIKNGSILSKIGGSLGNIYSAIEGNFTYSYSGAVSGLYRADFFNDKAYSLTPFFDDWFPFDIRLKK